MGASGSQLLFCGPGLFGVRFADGGRLPGRAPQEGEDVGHGAGGVRAKGTVGPAGGNYLDHRPVDGVGIGEVAAASGKAGWRTQRPAHAGP